MKITGNTILITGGGGGIGRGLAEAFQAKGNQVIITGRRTAVLEETAAANPGMAFRQMDVADAEAVRTFASQIVQDYPALNVLINNAGIMRVDDLAADTVDLATSEEVIATNLLGPIRLTAALTPHLRQKAPATIINVSSGLAFVPIAAVATYCATKAALHSYSQSLRFQLRDTGIQVIELIPPAVGTDLMPDSRANPTAMTLDSFIAESMGLLKANPSAGEICVEDVKALRMAEARGRYDAAFGMLNQAR